MNLNYLDAKPKRFASFFFPIGLLSRLVREVSISNGDLFVYVSNCCDLRLILEKLQMYRYQGIHDLRLVNFLTPSLLDTIVWQKTTNVDK